jgi:hypothetical protein
VDWFTTVVDLGRTLVGLSASISPDVTFSIGAPVNGKCVVVLSDVRQAAVTAIHGPAPVCFAVSSASHTLSAYRVSTSR